MAWKQTPSQTVVPFFACALTPAQHGYPLTGIAGPRLFEDEPDGERIIVEGCVLDGAGQPIEDALIDLAYRQDLPLVATNEAFFADKAMHQAHDALLCIADSAYVSQADRRRVTAEHCSGLRASA